MNFPHPLAATRIRVQAPTAVLVLTVISLVACDRPQPAQPRAPAKIGANLSLTGDFPYWSQQIKRGLDLALEHARAKDTVGTPVIIYEDNQGDPTKAVTAFHKLLDVDRVVAIVTAHTPIAKAQCPLAGESAVPLVATVVSAVNFGLETEWCFLDWPSHDLLTPPLVQHAYSDMGARRAATFVVNDAYGTDGAKLFQAGFLNQGGQIVAKETMGATDSELRGQATKIVNARPDVLYMVARDAALARGVQQVRQAGYKGKILGANAFDAPIVWKTLGPLGDSIVFANVELDTESVEARQFEADYQRMYSEAPDWVSLYGYSLGQYLIRAVQDADTSRARVRNTLSSLHFSTIRGTLVMNASREIEQQPALYIRQNGVNARIRQP